jgi:hypothetical protein
MGCRWLWTAGLLGLACLAVTGCDKLPFGQTAATDFEDEFDEFGDIDEAPASQSRGGSPGRGAASPDLTATTANDLSLKLDVGQRFPLTKSVEQRLTQQLPTGPVVAHTRLELTMSLMVEEQRGPSRRLGVRYHRVRYQQDLGGERVEFDSAQPIAAVPSVAAAYAGLKDNGFSFWLGPDNRVGELIGFPEFLQRCVSHLSVEQRPVVLQQLQSLGSSDGLANFVDDSIGLLPNPADPQLAGQPLRVGSSWQHTPTGSSPGDAVRCLLKELSPQSAEISLLGVIPPTTYLDPIHQFRLTVRGGQLTGTCVVDRQTGMPTQSRVERTLEMVAQLPDGTEIPQRKDVLTTVVAYLDQAAPAAAYAPPAAGVQPVSYAPPAATGPRAAAFP